MLLIMVFGENTMERDRLGKRLKPKSCDGKQTEFRSPTFSGLAVQIGNCKRSQKSEHTRVDGCTRRRDHISCQPHGPGHSLRENYLDPIRTGLAATSEQCSF